MTPRLLAAFFLMLLLWAGPPDGIGRPSCPSHPAVESASYEPSMQQTLARFRDYWLWPAAWAAGTSVRLEWDPTTNPLVEGYRIHYGTESGRYTRTLEVKGRSTKAAVIENLEEGKTYFFAISSYDAKGKESVLSAEITNHPEKDNKKSLSRGGGLSAGTPTSERIPPSRSVAKTPEGKILPNR